MHKPVLLNEILNNLVLKPGEIFVDATAGTLGHSQAICQKNPGIYLVGLELDPQTIIFAREKSRTIKNCRIKIISANYKDLEIVLNKLKIKKVAGVLFDLGLSSVELAESGRGFSFLRNEPLLMTFGDPADYLITAKDIVNNWREENIRTILQSYGEEHYAKRIAKAIVKSRHLKPILTTFDLVSVIEKAVPVAYRKKRLHFATKTFQALRIAVNDELQTLEKGLVKAFHFLAPKGRLLVISFHSLEDRIVKRFFQKMQKNKEAVLITKKPIRPSPEEIKENPRARSAKLRILEKL